MAPTDHVTMGAGITRINHRIGPCSVIGPSKSCSHGHAISWRLSPKGSLLKALYLDIIIIIIIIMSWYDFFPGLEWFKSID